MNRADVRVENFGWLIEGELAGSGRPIHHEELVWLREQGIGAIASLTERSLRREKMLHRLDPLGFIYRHIIIPFSSREGFLLLQSCSSQPRQSVV